MNGSDHFTTPLAWRIWDERYRWRNGDVVHDAGVEDTWRRIARALAAAEPRDRELWERRFYALLGGFRFLPGGRIQAGAGTGREVTLLNCFVMGRIDDSSESRYAALRESALTMQQGGGIGCDFSSLAPAGDPLGHGVATGPLAAMRVWDDMCATLAGTGARRGAMMATLACDHPDVEDFVAAKAEPGALTRFNLSVLVSDAFMAALAAGGEWPLVFPCASVPRAPGAPPPRVHRRVRARELWDRIVRASYDYAEPGVVFIDRVRREDNLRYAETIHAVNPCGEIPLPELGACDLGSLNLTAFIDAPFTQQADFDWNALRGAAALAVRMLDDVYEITGFPLPRQREAAHASRRIGLGITGLADALAMLGIAYGDRASLKIAADLMREICHAAYRASTELAKERGAFPAFVAGAYLESPFVAALPGDIRAGIAAHGIRNSHLTAIAPAGSISLLANNVSSGLEPVFAVDYRRAIRDRDGSLHFEDAVDYAVQVYRRVTDAATQLPPALVTAADVDPEHQLAMQAALQPYVDNAISKTVSLPADFPFARARGLFESAYERGLKGCTVYRPNAVTGAVLVREGEDERCCGVRRPLSTEETRS